jgi:hypothetical protein
MSAPTLDRPQAATPTSSTARRRRRRVLLLVATALVVVAASVGASLALANRTTRQPALAPASPAAAPSDQPASPAGPDAAADQTAGSRDTADGRDPGTPQATGSGGGETAPVLPDGRSDAYITRVDAGRNRIVVDVVQVFHDRAAVQAAIADGRSPTEARYLTTWVRNQNPRLRTLPLADGLRVDLRGACEEPAGGPTVLDRLAANARSGDYYYTLTVSDGKVQRIQEHLAINAC